jgi:mono/diheme cytochrome c family protein
MAEPVSALKGIDRALAIGSWLTAGVLVVMLFLGPAVIANDDATITAKKAGAAPYGGKSATADGATVFKANCGSCHTLSAAGTSGQVGPNLDDTTLSAADIEATVRSGRGAMPSFDGKLSDAEINAVAAFVASP